jgi:hypothetical protein
MKLLSWVSACIFLLFSAAIANAQPGCGISAPGTQVTKLRPVTGAPFSADIVWENTRVLNDGNRIVEERHGRIDRDSQGRSRCELEDARKTITVIEIVDPVAKVAIRLDPRNKLATVTHLPQTPPATAPSSQPVAEKKPEKLPAAPDPRHTMQTLSSRELEGLTVTGTRFTNIIEAQQEGNDKPITTSLEEWYSGDLKLTLLSIRDDPRNGKMVDKVFNIHTNEPEPAVFRIPDGYTVKDLYCRAGLCKYDSE